jgi:biotin carboxylase
LKATVLIATTSRWFPTARLAMALAKAGFTVDAVCPSRHPLKHISAVRKRYSYDSLGLVPSFAEAIAAARPDIVMPGDECAVLCLHRLYDQARHRGKSGEPLCALIERSVGHPDSFRIVSARAAVMRLAREESILVPRTSVVADKAGLTRCAEEFLFPLVLKADETSSGEGVRIVRSMEEAIRAFRALRSPVSALRAAKRAIVDQDMRFVLPVLLRQHNTVNAQEFIDGQDATSLVACWNGDVLASLHFEVVKKQYRNGPASVMRRIEIPEVEASISKIVGRLKLSGLHGFDFLLEKQTGRPYLIEMNPRPTQVGHLTLGRGHDLPAAFYAAVTGTPPEELPTLTENDTIALFPQEWLRNPSSLFLQTAYHDIPWEEPELIVAGARQRRRWMPWPIGKNRAASFLGDKVLHGND